MKTFFYLVTGCTVLGVFLFVRAWFRADDAVSAHWIAQHGSYNHLPRYHPEEPTQLERLRKIAAAQHSQDQ